MEGMGVQLLWNTKLLELQQWQYLLLAVLQCSHRFARMLPWNFPNLSIIQFIWSISRISLVAYLFQCSFQHSVAMLRSSVAKRKYICPGISIAFKRRKYINTTFMLAISYACLSFHHTQNIYIGLQLYTVKGIHVYTRITYMLQISQNKT